MVKDLTWNRYYLPTLRAAYGVTRFSQIEGVAQLHPRVTMRTVNKVLNRSGCLHYKVISYNKMDFRVVEVFNLGAENTPVFVANTMKRICEFLINQGVITMDQLWYMDKLEN